MYSYFHIHFTLSYSKVDFHFFHCRDAIISWIKKKTGPVLSNITTVEEAEQILKDEKKVVLGYLNDLVVIPLSRLMVFFSILGCHWT